eukprot:Platyproteum_vivax@DN10633_c0_g1_i1.p1
MNIASNEAQKNLVVKDNVKPQNNKVSKKDYSNRPKTYNKISQNCRTRICAAYTFGYPVGTICKLEGLPDSTVRTIVNTFRAEGRSAPKQKGGAKVIKVTPEIKKMLHNAVDENPDVSLGVLQQMVLAEFGVFVCTSTVSNALKQGALHPNFN